jgi:His/Glu/Gln/Arg/opine family amino acid ABC transporter permease subunit
MGVKSKHVARPRGLGDYLSDSRVLAAIAQVVFIVLLVGGLSLLWVNIFNSLGQRGLSIYFEVLLPKAGFIIGEAPPWYDSTSSSFGQAFAAGILNTLRVVIPGLISATVLGIFIGIFLLSSNWLIRTISRVYVEVLRNTPLLVQLYFWYFIVFFALPAYRDALAIPAEGVSFIHYRVPVYLILLLGLGWYSQRAHYPGRITGGAFGAVVFLEIVLRLSADWRPDLLMGLTGIFVVGLLMVFGKRPWQDFAVGFLVVVAGQIMITGLYLQLAYYLGIFPSGHTIAAEVAPFAFLSIKGMALPEIAITSRFGEWAAFAVIGVVLAAVLWLFGGHVTETTGRPFPRVQYGILSILGLALIGWLIVTTEPLPTTALPTETTTTAAPPARPACVPAESQQPFELILPRQGNLNYQCGTIISPEYAALLMGLVVYTSAFIAEIVRAGIQAVPYGQIEASRALGLSYPQTLNLIILPQALRVIIPPLGNQWLNLSKNSSLAIAIAFADTYQVGQTVMNTSGQSLVGFSMVFLVYITMSLLISFGMNIVNSRFQLVTR